MNGSTLTVIGNLVDDPILRFTPSGTAVVNFTVACNSRVYDQGQGKYVNGDATFIPVVAWRKIAENIAESLKKRQRVMVTGEVKQSNWETREGERRSRLELSATDVGLSLLFNTAKSDESTAVGNVGTDNWQQSNQWGTPPPARSDDEPPF